LGFGYLTKFFRFKTLIKGPGRLLNGPIDLFVGILEGLSEIIRVVSFTFRLFGNMLAGKLLILVSAFLVPFVFSIPFYGLELLVGFIQAMIFAGLTLTFATVAMAHHEE
jgi:F-type H+-transporting ATPase subunit a